MKDSSCSYWFQIGDTVQVSTSVKKAGIDLKGRIGKVVETWEKCSVDPTCCCAEFVDDNFAVSVQFEGKLNLQEEEKEEEDDDGNSGNSNSRRSPTTIILGIDNNNKKKNKNNNNFTHHFSEEELIKIKQPLSEQAVV